MLQSIRDHAQGWVAWVIVGLIILTFALFGIDQYARGDKTVIVAEVNGEGMTANAFLTLYSRQSDRLQQQFGDMYDQVVNDEKLRLQVLDLLIESEVIRQWSNKNGLLVSDMQLASLIHSASIFQQDGKFSKTIYEEILLRNGLNIVRFEDEQRRSLVEQQFTSLIAASRFATPTEVVQLAALQNQERKVSYLRIDKHPFLKTVVVTDAMVAASYETNMAQQVEAEQVSVDYIDLSQAEIAKNIDVNDDILQAYFEDNQSIFSLPEKRSAKHILILIEADSDEAQSLAMVAIDEINTKLAAGEKFEDLAKTYSQDLGSATSGGNLGTFEQGMMVSAFDEAVFSLEEGQVSEPIKTEFGYHLIKLEKIFPKQVQSFEFIKIQVAEKYKSQEAERQYFDLLEQLETLAYEHPDSLDPVADAVALKVKTSKLFSHDGGTGDVLSNPKVLDLAFSKDVLKLHLNSPTIQVSATRAIVLRLNQYKEARQKPLEEVYDTIKMDLIQASAIDEAATFAKSLLAKVSAGENPESFMQDGVAWNTIGWISRNTQELLPQMVSEAFKVVKPVKGATSWRSYQLETGDTVLIQISDIKTKALEEADTVPLADAFSQLLANAQNNGRLSTLIAQAKIVKKSVYLTIK